MSELPDGWVSVRLEEFASVNMGQSPKGVYVNENGNGLPFYQGKAEFGKQYPTPKKYCIEPTRIADAEDILLSIQHLLALQTCALRRVVLVEGWLG